VTRVGRGVLADPTGSRVDGSPETIDDVARRFQKALEKLPSGAKRRQSQDAIERWLPYYAGYSTEFAEAVLSAMRLPPTAMVYDPWNGSGTTTLAASRLGLRSVGVDMNPAALLVANARLATRRDAVDAQQFVRRVAKSGMCAEPVYGPDPDPLLDWLSPRNVNEFRSAQQAIAHELAACVHDSLHASGTTCPPLASLVMLSLVCAARRIAKVRVSSNPSRHSLSDASQSMSRVRLASVWPTVADEMAGALPSLDEAAIGASLVLGDARDGGGCGSPCDFILTSPPYLTRLDYADATSFVLGCLGTGRRSEAFKLLRRELMGAPLVRMREIPVVPASWPRSVAALLHSIRSHPTKASSSYYYKTYWQYFNDAQVSLRAIGQALRPGAFGALVVQSSYYKDLRVDLPGLYVDMARSEGMNAMVGVESDVRTVISSIHPGTRIYRASPSYKESVVVVRRSDHGN
jgi:SAM-dependent methyltransferase